FVFAPEVQGPLSQVAAAYLRRQRPTLVYLSGPPAYVEHELGRAAIERGIDNLRGVIDSTGCRVIMDHHALRDARWAERFARVLETGRVQTAARFARAGERVLETERRELWTRSRRPAAKAGTSSVGFVKTPPARLERQRKAMKGGHRE